MATLRKEGTNAALAAERRAAVRAIEAARQETEREERKARGAGALELERLKHLAAIGERAALAEAAAAEKQRMVGSIVRRSETAGRNLQLKAKQRLASFVQYHHALSIIRKGPKFKEGDSCSVIYFIRFQSWQAICLVSSAGRCQKFLPCLAMHMPCRWCFERH